MPKREEELPGTLKRSPEKAQRTYEETLESAHEEYDDVSRAHRTAYAALKHSFEKVGDHWEPKDERGPPIPVPRAGATARSRPPAASMSKALEPHRARSLAAGSSSRTNAWP